MGDDTRELKSEVFWKISYHKGVPCLELIRIKLRDLCKLIEKETFYREWKIMFLGILESLIYNL